MAISSYLFSDSLNTESNSSFLLKALLGLTGASLAYLAIAQLAMANNAALATTALVVGATAESVAFPVGMGLLFLFALVLLSSSRRRTHTVHTDHEFSYNTHYNPGIFHTHPAVHVETRGPVAHCHSDRNHHHHH